MAKVAFLGLGVMGFPMAGWLARKGHDVTVFNRTRAKAEQWQAAHGGRVAATPAAAAEGAEIVLSCVGDDADVRAIALGADGALTAMSRGAIYVDHTTASADVAREVAAAGAARGVPCLDAPVSGGQAGAEQGKLTVMAGGETEPFAVAEPVIRAYAHNVRLLGPAGAGQLTKMVNQIAIAGVVQGLAEALNFARKGCPSNNGARNYLAGAYSPSTNLYYLSINDVCTGMGGETPDRMIGMNVNTGEFEVDQAARVVQSSAKLTTAGGLLFSGAADRYFRAFDDRDGTLLWETRLQDVPNAFPITYMVEGRQYVAMIAGNPGLIGNGAARATPELQRPTPTSVLWVWQLP
jgi:3-hydroxyisobutyrate dehydrogenase-like beta-hydroxyacid dehydrogenase